VVESRIVIPVVVGSNPIIHPIFPIPEAWAQDLFYDSPVPQTLQAADDGMKLLEVNAAYVEYLGYPREQLIGRDPIEFHAPGDERFIRGERARYLDETLKGKADRAGLQGVLKGRCLRDSQGREKHYVLAYRWFKAANGQEIVHVSIFDNTLEVWAQRMLEQQVEQQNRSFDQAPVGMLLLDAAGKVSRVNQVLLHQLGCNNAELLGREDPFSAMGDAETKAILERHWARVENTEKLVQARIQVAATNGRVYWFDLHSRNIGRANSASGSITSAVNVTGEHVLATELRKLVLQQSALLRNAGAGIAYVGDDRLLRVNPVLARMIGGAGAGKTEGVLTGKLVGEVLRLDPDWGVIHTQAEEVLKQDAVFHAQVMLQVEGRSPLPCQLGIQYLDSDQPQMGFILSLVDLSPSLEHRKTRAALERSEDVLQQLGDSVDDAVLVVDRGLTRLAYANPAFEKYFGLSLGQLANNPRLLLSCMPAAQGSELLNALAVVRRNRMQACELPIKPKGQDITRLLRVRLSVLKNSDDQVLLVCEDITELRESEQRRQLEAMQQRERLIREVHHRIKNNLQGVAGLLQQVARSRPEIGSTLEDSANQIYAIAQVHGLQVKDSDDVLPSRLLEGLCEVIQRSLPSSTTLLMAIESSSPYQHTCRIAEAEAVPLALVLNELLGNAVRHSAPHQSREIQVSLTWAAEGTCCITVSNPGSMPAQFDFSRVPLASTGLGLVRAMLPRKGVVLSFENQGHQVRASLVLSAPVLKTVT
jgi:PAS domain S-box-containing protein